MKNYFLGVSVIIAIGLMSCSDDESQNKIVEKDCGKLFTAEDKDRALVALPTDSGMHALWIPEPFKDVCSYESWRKKLLENKTIEEQIKNGYFVPLYVHSDGTPAIEVRIGTTNKPVSENSEEKRLIVASSGLYWLKSNGIVNISGIEYISGLGNEDSIVSLILPKGDWSVRVHYLKDQSPNRNQEVLYPPDFLVLINPVINAEDSYRTSVETFNVNVWDLL